MCIILYKPKGSAMPPVSILRECMRSNPHGAGYAIRHANGNGISMAKGFFTPELLQKAITKDLPGRKWKQGKDIDLVIHARITTSGGTSSDLCHPFLVDTIQTRTLRYKGHFPVFFHNGILAGGDAKESDTCALVRLGIGSPELRPHIWEAGVQYILSTLAAESRSKFILMDANHIQTYGEPWYEDKGIWYSNKTYKESVFSQSAGDAWDGWDNRHSAYDERMSWERETYGRGNINSNRRGQSKSGGATVPALCPECATTLNAYNAGAYCDVCKKWRKAATLVYIQDIPAAGGEDLTELLSDMPDTDDYSDVME